MKSKIVATSVNKWRFGDLRKDFSDVKGVIEKNKNSDLIVFPETCLSNFNTEREFKGVVEKLEELSKKYGLLICVGIEEIEGEKKYNSSFLFDGDETYKYRKVHLVWNEPEKYERGNLKFPVYETSIGKIGMLICYDNEFPEAMRSLKLEGAEIICMPSAWPKKISKYWDMLARVRARENQVFLIASNDFNERCGKSKIVNPFGEVIGEVKENKKPFSCTTTRLESKKIGEVKTFLGPNTDWIKNRRPEIYGLIRN
mgnify:CR=1 FL=1